MSSDQISLDRQNIKESVSRLGIVMGRSTQDLRYLEEHRNSLCATLEDIIQSKDPARILQAYSILDDYQSFFRHIESIRAGRYIVQPILDLSERITGIVESEKMNEYPVVKIQLATATWSLPTPFTGKVFTLGSYLTRQSFEDEIEQVRKTYFGDIIFLLDGKAPVALLARWPDPGAMIVASSGGNISECMNYARGYKVPYINGASDYFSRLKEYKGKVIEIVP